MLGEKSDRRSKRRMLGTPSAAFPSTNEIDAGLSFLQAQF
jgi:hypothetical protein